MPKEVLTDELWTSPRTACTSYSATASGAAPADHPVIDHATRRSLEIVDATYPLIAEVHADAHRFAAEDKQIARNRAMCVNVHFGLHRLGQRPARTLTHHLVDHRTGLAGRVATRCRVRHHAEHGAVPSRPVRQRRPP